MPDAADFHVRLHQPQPRRRERNGAGERLVHRCQQRLRLARMGIGQLAHLLDPVGSGPRRYPERKPRNIPDINSAGNNSDVILGVSTPGSTASSSASAIQAKITLGPNFSASNGDR